MAGHPTRSQLPRIRKGIAPEPVAILLCGIGGAGKSTVSATLRDLLRKRGYKPRLITFDRMRKSLTPAGQDPFSRDRSVKRAIYGAALGQFRKDLRAGRSLVIDTGLSNESIREWLRRQLGPQLKIVHVKCPLPVAILRDTARSLSGQRHDRGRYLYLRAFKDLWKPKDERFPQPGITYPFDPPECADVRVKTFFRRAPNVAKEVVAKLGL